MSDLYERDFITWTEEQARLLRDEAARPTNRALDWEHLAEEVEDLGKSERRVLASQVRRVMLHLLKLELSPAAAPRAGWKETVADGRSEIRSQLRSDPGLKPRLATIILDEAPDAGELAVQSLRAYGEDASGVLERLRAGDCYTEEQILGDWLPPPAGPR